MTEHINIFKKVNKEKFLDAFMVRLQTLPPQLQS
jgi:hypothetical protein